MKRVVLFCAIALAATGCAFDLNFDDDEIDLEALEVGSTEQALGGELAGLGEPINIDFGPDSTVTQVLVVLRAALLHPIIANRSSLDMTITSINGIDHFHGTDLVPLTQVEEFSRDGRLVNAIVNWTEDNQPEVVGDVYTVCSTLQIELRRSTWYGPERCQTFGPF